MEHNSEIQIGYLSSYLYTQEPEVFNSYMEFLQSEASFSEGSFDHFYSMMVQLASDMEDITKSYINICKKDIFISKMKRFFLNSTKELAILEKMIPNYLKALEKDLSIIELTCDYLLKVNYENNNQDLSDIYLVLSFMGIYQQERHEQYVDQFEYYYDLHDQLPPSFRLKDLTNNDLINFTEHYVNNAVLKKV
jgi:hypothetical protein